MRHISRWRHDFECDDVECLLTTYLEGFGTYSKSICWLCLYMYLCDIINNFHDIHSPTLFEKFGNFKGVAIS